MNKIKVPKKGSKYKKIVKIKFLTLNANSISKKIIKNVENEKIKIFNFSKFIFWWFVYSIKQHNTEIKGMNKGLKNLLCSSWRISLLILLFSSK